MSDTIDEETCAYYLEVPSAQLVELQAYFEMYESLGTVRTIDLKRSLVCILTTTSLAEPCQQALLSLRDRLQWRSVERPQDVSPEAFLGYGKKAGNN
ncbi:MAG: hypothetical protein KDD62_00350 [Bdellovibrionales bacterium]|nr:hypothetical protein [Bdellovibrionales bacterium]